MKTIRIADTTLCREGDTLRFKEQIEIARQLEKLGVDIIELPAIEKVRQDTLLVRTVASFVKNATLSVAAGITADSIQLAAAALEGAAHPCIRIQLPVSPVGMEYTCRKKPDGMLKWIGEAVALAKESGCTVEFCAVDATRAEGDYLARALTAAVEAGADCVSVCDSTGIQLPDAFAAFIGDVCKAVRVPVGVACDNKNGLACAQAILAAVSTNATLVKTAIDGTGVPLETFAALVKDGGDSYGVACNIRHTELHRIAKQIGWVTGTAKSDKAIVTATAGEESIHLDAKDDMAAVTAAAARLGYDLSEDDQAKVYEEFGCVAAKKNVGAKELEAIVAAAALQVPATYQLVSYVINNGNIITASAQISLQKGDTTLSGVAMGDGPIDAAFQAIEQVIGCRYELDDFQIQSVTEGQEAMARAVVKLRSEGRLYAGSGISTDIMGASIRAYINAVNKIVYEEV